MLTQFLGESATARLLENEPQPETVYVDPRLLNDADRAIEDRRLTIIVSVDGVSLS